MSTIDEIQGSLDQLTSLKAEKEQLKAVYDDIVADYETLRLQILADLTSAGLKSLKNDRLAVSRKEKTTITITNQHEVLAWLEAQGFSPQEYTKLDEARAKSVIEPRLKKDGVLPPGVSAEVTEYISVATVKEKK